MIKNENEMNVAEIITDNRGNEHSEKTSNVIAKLYDRITNVLVDTSAYVMVDCDFMGIKAPKLPSFFSILKEKNIKLVSCSILDNEILEKIEEKSSICKEYREFCSKLDKCKDAIIRLNGCDENTLNTIGNIKLKNEIYQTYKEYYSNAIQLDFVSPEIIFKRYFALEPPFMPKKNKKNEFPDAFVIEAAKQYIEANKEEVLLVVTNDNDWIESFSCLENVVILKDINSVIEIFTKDYIAKDEINEVIRVSFNDIEKKIVECMENEEFYISEFDFEDRIKILRAKVDDIKDVFPLQKTNSSLFVCAKVLISIIGTGTVFDQENSIWDEVEREYFIKKYFDVYFDDGVVEIECFIDFEYNSNNPLDSIKVSKVTINNRNCIEILATNIHIEEI